MDDTKNKKIPNPILKANIFSKIFFCWLAPLLLYGKNHDLKMEDIYETLPDDRSEYLGNKLEKFWKLELKKSSQNQCKPNLTRAIRKTFGKKFLLYGVFYFFLDIVIKTTVPLILRIVIKHFDTCSKTTTFDAFLYATAIVIVIFLRIALQHHSDFLMEKLGMRLRIACSNLIYRKIIRLSCSVTHQTTGNSVINLLSNDVARFDQLFLYLHYFWIVPLQAIVIMYVITQYVNITSIIGVFLILVLIIPIQVYCGRIIKKMRSKTAIKTDKRISVISDVINGIRVIKMFAWEKPFQQLLLLCRKHEINVILHQSYIKGFNRIYADCIERSTLFVTILFLVLQNQTITADKIFFLLQFNLIFKASAVLNYPKAIANIAEAEISIKRIKEFLLLEEVKLNPQSSLCDNEDISLSVRNASASWSKETKVNVIDNINVSILQKKLVAIVGAVGAGKSSFLKLILGELSTACGEVFIKGKISYASQEPWLFNSSIRNNILFGEPYNKEKYDEVIAACALMQDFEQLPYGDKTLVSDKGMNLSGGQYARINLARAVYRNADIYLLDDPLSAVDTNVSKKIFEKCINGLLKDKTRLLVTNNKKYLNEVDNIILLNNGTVQFEGTFTELTKNKKYMHYLPATVEPLKLPMTQELRSNDNQELTIINNKKNKMEEQEEQKETDELIAKGQISGSMYWKYLRTGASRFKIFFVLTSFLVAEFIATLYLYWLGHWSSQKDKQLRNFMKATNSSMCFNVESMTNVTDSILYQENMSAVTITNDMALYVYGSLVLCNTIMNIIKCIMFMNICSNTSMNLHNNMFSRLMKAPLRFFNANPSGRIVNRFSKDTGIVDEIIPMIMVESLIMWVTVLASSIQICIINWWTIIFIVIVTFFYQQTKNLYITTALNIKRLEGNAKSPVFSHVNSSITGLLTIRYCQTQKLVGNEFDSYQDNHTGTYHLYLATAKAFELWLDIISATVVAFITYSFIVIDYINFAKGDEGKPFAGFVGLAISQSMILCYQIRFGVKQFAALTAQMTSVERMFQFTKLEQEGQLNELNQKPKKEWPNKGKLEFKNLYLKYSEEDEPVLKNLNFIIESKMKVGIVGRTGAGKSSLISAIFRLNEFEGSLIVDDVDIKKIDLNDLRSKITIIPQEPILFCGSLRFNLDPFKKCDDATLWSVLKDVKLDKIFTSLDLSIKNDLSIGQRQLICLARAIVKKNKIVILDEPTANMDPVTESLTQKIIKEMFEDCTILMVAHKLNMIMDCDRILVVEHGEVVEYDHPNVLLQNKDSYFSQMVK